MILLPKPVWTLSMFGGAYLCAWAADTWPSLSVILIIFGFAWVFSFVSVFSYTKEIKTDDD